MPQPYEKIIDQLLVSKSFKKAVKEGETEEFKNDLKTFIKEYHKALCIQSVKVYAKLRTCTDQIIRPYLREQDHPRIEFYPKT